MARAAGMLRKLAERILPIPQVFRKWQKDGIFEKIFRELNLDADIEYICIDSTSVKVHESANGGVKKGR